MSWQPAPRLIHTLFLNTRRTDDMTDADVIEIQTTIDEFSMEDATSVGPFQYWSDIYAYLVRDRNHIGWVNLKSPEQFMDLLHECNSLRRFSQEQPVIMNVSEETLALFLGYRKHTELRFTMDRAFEIALINMLDGANYHWVDSRAWTDKHA